MNSPPPPSEAPEFEKAPAEAAKSKSQQIEVPYTIPEWSGVPCRQFRLEVFKDGTIVDQLNVCEKGAYMFGLDHLCDFVLKHPTISRFHAVLQFMSSGDAYIFDLGSTHGTFINGNQVGKKVYQDLHVGDSIGFGHLSHLYNFRGLAESMPPKKKYLKAYREYKLHEEQTSRQDDAEEITWQTYKGQLTEEQTKTRDKITKRLEKIDHTKKEIDAIRAKYITQGGLTQGQQTQIAVNEQTTEQSLKVWKRH